MGRTKQLAFWALVLVALTALFELTDLDLSVQDHLFHFETGRWLVDRNAPVLKFLFYTGIKGALIAFGVSLLWQYGRSLVTRNRDGAGEQLARQRYLMVILSLMFIPGTIAGLKAVTHMYCPSQIERYGGDKPYIKLFDAYPETCARCNSGRCYPAGHASGGFSLLVLAHVFRKRSYKLAGLGVGLGLGWAMGGYQMMKGAHFLSHTLVTMIIAWMMSLCLVEVARRVHPAPDTGATP
ncbi:phosphatase PAP2 family protein [Desulfoluna sp.]|uniref:phosphatase PAP2 family protein n=1 Tax=Desulfoluna sp. TaxID=2045199 RepID=UPI0026134154|nr:phosphatase PAP2 family protein [Desulfoluna sp.]